MLPEPSESTPRRGLDEIAEDLDLKFNMKYKPSALVEMSAKILNITSILNRMHSPKKNLIHIYPET